MGLHTIVHISVSQGLGVIKWIFVEPLIVQISHKLLSNLVSCVLNCKIWHFDIYGSHKKYLVDTSGPIKFI